MATGRHGTRIRTRYPRPILSLSLSLSELAAIRFGRASSVDSTETEFGTGGGRRKGKRKSRME